MEPRENCAAVKDVQIKLSKEECVIGIEQRRNSAAVKDAQIKLSKEGSAEGMERRMCKMYNLDVVCSTLLGFGNDVMTIVTLNFPEPEEYIMAEG